jgi:hypothetical protein
MKAGFSTNPQPLLRQRFFFSFIKDDNLGMGTSNIELDIAE